MIIYIHGFSSHGLGAKANAFREYFKSVGEPFIAPSLSYIPELAIETLAELIHSYDTVHLIGSSLGGFYALYLAQRYHLKAILINPSISPHITLKRVLGETTHFFDLSHFEWNEQHLRMLQKYEVSITDERNFLLLLQKGDDLLNYKEALAKLPKAQQIVEEGGSHSFDGIERYFDKSLNFFRDL